MIGAPSRDKPSGPSRAPGSPAGPRRVYSSAYLQIDQATSKHLMPVFKSTSRYAHRGGSCGNTAQRQIDLSI